MVGYFISKWQPNFKIKHKASEYPVPIWGLGSNNSVFLCENGRFQSINSHFLAQTIRSVNWIRSFFILKYYFWKKNRNCEIIVFISFNFVIDNWNDAQPLWRVSNWFQMTKPYQSFTEWSWSIIIASFICNLLTKGC